MNSKKKPKPTVAESKHIKRLAEQPCAVCDRSGPSEVHEINQGQWFTSIPLCFDCHRGSKLGIHGEKRAWLMRKMDELEALNKSLGRML